MMAPLTDRRHLWNDGSALEVHGVVVTRLTPGPAPVLTAEPGGGVAELAGGTAQTTLVRLDVPLGGAVGHWHPAAGWDRHLAADWMTGWRTIGLAGSAPLGCLYDGSANALLAYATDRLVATTRLKFGVGERTGRFGVWLAMDLEPGEVCRIRIAQPGQPHADALRELARWQSPETTLPVPDAGRTATYSTWYSYHQDVSAAAVEAEAELAAEAGCGLLILDDGWQRGGTGGGYSGCGDWEPDADKFPDFAAHVAEVHAAGLKYMAWIAPLLLGQDSAVREALAGFAPHARPEWGCHVLDPRHAEVRAFVVDRCARLVETYGLDGLKIDFLDSASVYASGTYAEAGDTADAVPTGEPAAEGWIPDVGTAMRVLLAALRDRLRAARGTDFLIEFRQPYTGPAMLEYANLLRASDCPADAVANRVKSLDLALLAPDVAIHSDMLMWDASGTAEQAARQLLAVLHTIPQISTRLADLPAEHRAMIAFWLGFWRDRRDLLTRGRLRAGRPDELYPLTTVTDAERAVAVLHTVNHLVPLDLSGLREAAVVNATDSGRVVLDLRHQAAVRLTVSDACGRTIREEHTRLALGPSSIAVPPSGLCLITEITEV
ncbi:glycoside hydrolase family 36 protein [Catenulispora pinisilvae]|uniref:glycoside hydrolase family 36 protein n=1 Tax=Catenulispora pinisilvae TaxID=2705253 RepID=UPI00189178CE|nr:glycoside hydrolase family 36 protein [Catenulispora pinisilvae]